MMKKKMMMMLGMMDENSMKQSLQWSPFLVVVVEKQS
jgi:hypothetical protein